MKKRLIYFLLLLPHLSFAGLDQITWKGIYYQGKPTKSGITQNFCREHTPGSFIHVVQDALLHPIITDKGIKLDHPHFNIDKLDDIYLIHGSFLMTGQSQGKQWQDHIYYYLYKYTEAGVTKGVWHTQECKGLYKGIVVKDKNSAVIQ